MSLNEFYRTFYKLEITLKSSLSIGSGANDFTDHDVIVDAVGTPFIPATAIAGVLRSYVSKKHSQDIEDKIFGFIPTEKNSLRNERESQIRFFDGLYKGGKDAFFIANRDCVKLKDKLSVNGAKFDMQVVEPGAKFVSYIELFENNEDVIENALSALNSGIIRLGSKTSRGYGCVCVKAYKKKVDSPSDWLDFDLFDEGSWSESRELSFEDAPELKLTIGLKSIGGISIREYTTDVSDDETVMPDYKMLSLHTKNGNPVIPGTSWAGVIRSRMSEFLEPNKIESLFGFVNEREKSVQKSKIIIDESVLSGGVFKNITRNALNRFTGKTKDKSLYTESTYYFGNTNLSLAFTEKPDEEIKKALLFTLADLHNGLISVGGLVSIGRGLFEITSVNGKEFEGEDIIGFLKEEIADAL